jgi:hypothetical protein
MEAPGRGQLRIFAGAGRSEARDLAFHDGFFAVFRTFVRGVR